jgi:hypothetical protein
MLSRQIRRFFTTNLPRLNSFADVPKNKAAGFNKTQIEELFGKHQLQDWSYVKIIFFLSEFP